MRLQKQNLSDVSEDVPPALDSLAERRKNPDGASSQQISANANAKRQFSWAKLAAVFIRLILAIAIVIGAAIFGQQMIADREQPAQRAAFERSFTVAVMEATRASIAPTVSTFGEIAAEQIINVRAPVAGKILFVSDDLRSGGLVRAGRTIIQVDPFDYQSALDDARSALSDANISLAEAEEQLRIQGLNVSYASSSLDLGVSDLTRATALANSGSLTSQQLESRELVVSQREQTLKQAESSLILQETAVTRRVTAIETAQRQVVTAERTLSETTIIAPFDAVVISNTAVPGAIVSQNESIASFYDANALEAKFTLSELQFGQLLSDGIIGRAVEVTWDIEPNPIRFSGTIVRIGAEVDASLGGVELFAELENAAATAIRPGTFVSIKLSGVVYENALKIPETALYEGNHFYVLRDNRMARIEAAVLARDGENVIISAPISDGERVIVTRLAQAGEGLLVNLVGEEPSNQRGERESDQNQIPNSAPGGPGS